ncbi:hypothetical protein ACP4OV_016584 [Aristida adscensionis]
MAGAPPPPVVGEMMAPPFLLFDAGHNYQHAQYGIASRLQVDIGIDVLRNEYYRCFETPQGWVLLLDRRDRYTFLWRPQDRRKIHLSRMSNDPPRNCKCLLTHKLSIDFDPCVVVILDLDRAQYWFCHVEEPRWQHRRYKLATLDAEDRRQNRNMARGVGIAAVGGKIYYELGEHELGVLEFNPVHIKPMVTRIRVDMGMVSIPSGFSTWLRYFVESCDELFLVILYFRPNCRRKVFRVALYQMDFSASAWCKVDRIGDRVFLLCGDQSGLSRFGASCSASDHGLNANRIYFFNHISHSQDTLHVFDLANKTEEVTIPFSIAVSPLCPPFWMLPTEDPNTSVQSNSTFCV